MAAAAIGGLITLLQADPTLAALVPEGAWGDEIPVDLPGLPWVVVKDLKERAQWITPTIALVKQRTRFTVYAEGATTAGQDNPAEAIISAIRAALNMAQQPANPKLFVVGVVEEDYSLTESPKRSAAGNRVDVADMTMKLVLQRTV